MAQKVETRLVALESKFAPPIRQGERDPGLVEFYKYLGRPGDEAPKGITLKEILDGLHGNVIKPT